jgi:dienelactone hydrolase
MEKISVKVDGNVIIGVLFFPNKNRRHKVVFLMNGQGGVKERYYLIAKGLVSLGYVVCCFDFRGRGESQVEAVPPFGNQIDDAKSVVDYVTSLSFVNQKEIALVGTSMGGYVSASLANYKDGIKKIILLEPSILLPEDEKLPYLDISAEDVRRAVKSKSVDAARPLKDIAKYKGSLYLTIHEDSSYFEIMELTLDLFTGHAKSARKVKTIRIKDAPHAILKKVKHRKMVLDELKKFL